MWIFCCCYCLFMGGWVFVLGCCWWWWCVCVCVCVQELFVLGVHHFLQLRDVRFSYFVNFCFGLGFFLCFSTSYDDIFKDVRPNFIMPVWASRYFHCVCFSKHIFFLCLFQSTNISMLQWTDVYIVLLSFNIYLHCVSFSQQIWVTGPWTAPPRADRRANGAGISSPGWVDTKTWCLLKTFL